MKGKNKGIRDVDKLVTELDFWWKKSLVYATKKQVKTWQALASVFLFAGIFSGILWTISVDIETKSKAALLDDILAAETLPKGAIIPPACTETDIGADFQALGVTTSRAGYVSNGKASQKPPSIKIYTDKCSSKTALKEYYCNPSVKTGVSSMSYSCTSCVDGVCTNPTCKIQANCNDKNLYTLDTCVLGTIPASPKKGFCSYEKIAKYYDFTLKKAAGESAWSLYEGSIKSLNGTENLDELFAAQAEDGYIARYTSANGKKVDTFSFDFTSDYIRGYYFKEDGSLVEDEIVNIKLPYGEEGYKSVAIEAPRNFFQKGKNKKAIITIDLAALELAPVQPVVKADQKPKTQKTVAKKTTSSEGEVLGEFTGTVCGVSYPKTVVAIPDRVYIEDRTSAGGGMGGQANMRAILTKAIENLGPDVVKFMPKNVIFTEDWTLYRKEYCGPNNYDACYKRKADTMIVPNKLRESLTKDGHTLEELISHEIVHSTVFKSLTINELFCIKGNWLLKNTACAIAFFSPDSAYADEIARWKSVSNENEYGEDVYEKLKKSWAERDQNDFSGGFTTPYGASDVLEDVSEFAMSFSKNPGKFVNYINGKTGIYYEKLKLLRDLGIITPEQFNVVDQCKCFSTDMFKNGDYESDNDHFIKGEGDFCIDADNLNESYCNDGVVSSYSQKCTLGCDSAKGSCRSCQVSEDKNTIKYYSKTPTPTSSLGEWIELKNPQCMTGTKLMTRACDSNEFSQPINLPTTCIDICKTGIEGEADKCMVCPVQDCKGGKIGSTKCEINTALEEPYHYTFDKCIDPDKDGCGEWDTRSCPNGFCWPGKTKCGNYCNRSYETDGGINYTQAGTVVAGDGGQYADYCYSSTGLKEYYCNTKYGVVYEINRVCNRYTNEKNNFCSNGACVEGSVTPPAPPPTPPPSTCSQTSCGTGKSCYNNACVSTCDPAKETDGGDNPTFKGSAIDYKGTLYTDGCLSLFNFKEYYCSSTGIQYKTYTCPSGMYCKDGYCAGIPIPGNPPPPPPPSPLSCNPGTRENCLYKYCELLSYDSCCMSYYGLSSSDCSFAYDPRSDARVNTSASSCIQGCNADSVCTDGICVLTLETPIETQTIIPPPSQTSTSEEAVPPPTAPSNTPPVAVVPLLFVVQ